MLKEDLIQRNPLRLMGKKNKNILADGESGAVLARAGLGKTAILVQISLDTQLRNQNVLHISLNDPVRKVCLWYDEVILGIAKEYDVKKTDWLRDIILARRLIMTFKVEGFSVPKLEERLNDLTAQNIFHPQMVIIDGLPIDKDSRKLLVDIKELAKRNSMRIWYTVTIHRHEKPDINGMPANFASVEDLFDAALIVKPKEEELHIEVLKTDSDVEKNTSIRIDPSTMLIKK